VNNHVIGVFNITNKSTKDDFALNSQSKEKENKTIKSGNNNERK
jgi:hypothetical protein